MISFVKKGGGKFVQVLQALPLTLPAALAAFSLVTVAHLLIGKFDMWLVLPVGTIAALMAGYWAQRLAQRRTSAYDPAASRRIDLLVLAGVLLWVVCNLPFTSEHLFTNRDPATYNLAATWLIDNQTTTVPIPDMPNVPGMTASSLGFHLNPDQPGELQPQGSPLLPALQAMAGKVAGIQGVLRINVLFGGLALLAFYGFARMILKPRWALLAVLVMGLTLPMMFFSRDAYTEPLNMAFVFGGLALLWYAERSRERWRWFLAGLVLGATTLARIDAYLLFVGIGLFGIVHLLRASADQLRQRWQEVGWLAAGMFGGGYLGWLSVSLLSVLYYEAHWHLMRQELYLLAVLLVAGAIAVGLQRRFGFVQLLDRLTSKWRDEALPILLGGFFAVLASRPLWFTGYETRLDGVVAPTFSEQTLNWFLWYIGPVTLVAGVVGLALVAVRLLRGKDTRLWPLMLSLAVMMPLYLLRPSITADQPWGMRRFLPLVLPGIVLLALLVFQRLFARPNWRFLRWRFDGKLLATVLATTAVLSPLFVTYPFLIRRLYVPELAQVQAICTHAPKDALVVWAGEARDFAVQPTRTICGNDTLGMALVSTVPAEVQSQLKTLATQTAGRVVVVGFFDTDTALLPLGASAQDFTVSSITYNEIDHSYKRAPRNAIDLQRTVLMGRLLPDGTLTKV